MWFNENVTNLLELVKQTTSFEKKHFAFELSMNQRDVIFMK